MIYQDITWRSYEYVDGSVDDLSCLPQTAGNYITSRLLLGVVCLSAVITIGLCAQLLDALTLIIEL